MGINFHSLALYGLNSYSYLITQTNISHSNKELEELFGHLIRLWLTHILYPNKFLKKISSIIAFLISGGL